MNTESHRGGPRAESVQLEPGKGHPSVGGIAATLGRELDTLLAIIQMNVEVGLETGPPELSDLFRDLMVACRRGVEISERLSRSSWADAPERGPIDVAALVEDMAPIVQDLVGEAIQCELVEALAHSPVVLGEREALQTLVLRIAAEARRAMPNGGTLRIALEDESVGHVRLVFETVEPTSLVASNGFFSNEPMSGSLSSVACARKIVQSWGAALVTGVEPAPFVGLVLLRVAQRPSRPPMITQSDRFRGSGGRLANVESMLRRSRNLLDDSRQTLARMRDACGCDSGDKELVDDERPCRDGVPPSSSSMSSTRSPSKVPTPEPLG